MIENFSLYIPQDKPKLKSFLPGLTSDGGMFRKAKQYSFTSEIGPVDLTVMPKAEIAGHLQGFKGYVSQLENTDILKEDAYFRIDTTRTVLGVILPAPIAPESPVFERLKNAVWSLGGFIFVSESILTEEGFLVGPQTHPKASMEAAARVTIKPDGSPPPQHLQDMRARNLSHLKSAGFKSAEGLPIGHSETLRPPAEIARRFGALAALFIYVAAPEDQVAEAELRAVIKNQNLTTALATAENNILSQPREAAHAEHGNAIGWKTENMWPLAWIFGFKPEIDIQSRQLQHEDIMALIRYVPARGDTIEDFLAKHPLKPTEEIVEMADRFYCAHNAVRSAQLGSPAVPPNFDPVGDGGVIHERRHALTWALSPGVDWDETDLST